jgi:hypothetical protein
MERSSAALRNYGDATCLAAAQQRGECMIVAAVLRKAVAKGRDIAYDNLRLEVRPGSNQTSKAK